MGDEDGPGLLELPAFAADGAERSRVTNLKTEKELKLKRILDTF